MHNESKWDENGKKAEKRERNILGISLLNIKLIFS